MEIVQAVNAVAMYVEAKETTGVCARKRAQRASVPRSTQINADEAHGRDSSGLHVQPTLPGDLSHTSSGAAVNVSYKSIDKVVPVGDADDGVDVDDDGEDGEDGGVTVGDDGVDVGDPDDGDDVGCAVMLETKRAVP